MRKKNAIYFVIISLIFCVFLTPSVVNADGSCTYKLDVDSLGLSAALKSASFTITVKDNGKVTKGKLKFVNINDTKEEAELTSGVNLDGQHTLMYKKMFDDNGDFYKAYKKRNNCPSMQFINQDSSGISAIKMVLNGQETTIDNSNSTSTPESTDPNRAQKKIYCNNIEKDMRDVKSGKVYFTTYEVNGVKLFSVVLKSKGKKVGDATDINYNATGNILYGGTSFSFLVNSADYDTYWSTKCSDPSTNIYMKADGGSASTTRVFQTTVPSTTENGSYNAAEAKYDTGKSTAPTYEDKSSLNDLNKKYDQCSQIIDMSEGKFGWLLQKILNYIKIAGPILVVLLSALDFIKAVASSDENVFKKAQSRLVIRLVAALALFLVPTLVQLLLGLINGITDSSCGLK